MCGWRPLAPIRNKSSDQVATLEDVARLTGVSTATVSRCLNAPSKVTEATRARVMDAVHELGYLPNFSAQALAAKRTNTFGAIIPTMENAIFARGLQAFQKALEARGITLLVASSGYDPALEEKQIKALAARGADALLLIGHDRSRAVYDFLERRRIPYLVAWVHDAAAGHSSIGFDNFAAMRRLTDEVIALGHRSLGLISAPGANNDRVRARCDGVRAAMRAHGLKPSALKIIETPYSINNGAQAFQALIEQHPDITVVLCGNDVLAAGAITLARARGIRVPEDISITGFDDLEIAEILPPGLTTIHVPHRQMGEGAATMLIELRDGAKPGKNIELEATIKWRNSLGPVPHSPADFLAN